MTREDLDFIGSMNMCDEISNEAYKKIVCHFEEQEPKTGHCKDCRWWRDSDGLYRRGSHAESKCPINRREVFEGNGYCYMFEAKMKSEGMI